MDVSCQTEKSTHEEISFMKVSSMPLIGNMTACSSSSDRLSVFVSVNYVISDVVCQVYSSEFTLITTPLGFTKYGSSLHKFPAIY